MHPLGVHFAQASTERAPLLPPIAATGGGGLAAIREPLHIATKLRYKGVTKGNIKLNKNRGIAVFLLSLLDRTNTFPTSLILINK